MVIFSINMDVVLLELKCIKDNDFLFKKFFRALIATAFIATNTTITFLVVLGSLLLVRSGF